MEEDVKTQAQNEAKAIVESTKSKGVQGYVPSDFGNLDLAVKLIECKLGQRSAKHAQVQPGHFFFKGSAWPNQEVLTGVTALAFVKRKGLWEDFEKPPICLSDDGAAPAARVLNPICGSCHECALGKFPNQLVTPDDIALRQEYLTKLQRTGEKPICNDILTVFAVDQRQSPFIMNFMKTQYTNAMKNLVNTLRYSGKRIFQVQFDVRVDEIKNKWGGFYEWIFENFRDVENVENTQRLHAFFGPNAQQMVADYFAKLDQTKEAEAVPEELEKAPF